MSKDWASATLDTDYFQESGLLFELNRRILHPIGLALAVVKHKETKCLRFVDCRDNPESLVFSPEKMKECKKKLHVFLTTFGQLQEKKRREKLGFAEQELPKIRRKSSEKRTKKKRYPARFGKDRFITAAQYLAELMCERRAKKEGASLPSEFWVASPHWKRIFIREVGVANKLIKRIDPEDTGLAARAIARVLRTQRGKGIYSLVAPFVFELVHKAALQIAAEALTPVVETPTYQEFVETANVPRVSLGKANPSLEAL